MGTASFLMKSASEHSDNHVYADDAEHHADDAVDDEKDVWCDGVFYLAREKALEQINAKNSAEDGCEE